MYCLNGRVALVTGVGGEHGIGHAVAVRLAADGADVVITDIVENPYSDHPSEWGGLGSVIREITGLGRRSISILADISNAHEVDSMVDEAVGYFGHVDILVHCAGSLPGSDRRLVVDLDEESWDRVFDVNAKGAFLSCRAVSRHMIKSGQGGKIVIVASASGKRPLPKQAAYNASKAASLMLTKSLAIELGHHNINVNAINPGAVDTDRTGYIEAALANEEHGGSPETWWSSEERRKFLKTNADTIPLGRVATSLDIANSAAFLASSESDYLTGITIDVSGGSLLR